MSQFKVYIEAIYINPIIVVIAMIAIILLQIIIQSILYKYLRNNHKKFYDEIGAPVIWFYPFWAVRFFDRTKNDIANLLFFFRVIFNSKNFPKNISVKIKYYILIYKILGLIYIIILIPYFTILMIYYSLYV